jgi:hypothetical protein
MFEHVNLQLKEEKAMLTNETLYQKPFYVPSLPVQAPKQKVKPAMSQKKTRNAFKPILLLPKEHYCCEHATD